MGVPLGVASTTAEFAAKAEQGFGADVDARHGVNLRPRFYRVSR